MKKSKIKKDRPQFFVTSTLILDKPYINIKTVTDWILTLPMKVMAEQALPIAPRASP